MVFDLDGLIVNSEDLYEEVGHIILSRRGFLYTPELRKEMMGRPGLEALEVMIQWHQLTEDSPAELLVETEEVFRRLMKDRLHLMPGCLKLLEFLETKKIPKGIGTSGSGPYAAELLKRLGIETCFEFVLTAEDVTLGKPNPEVYQKAIGRLGLQAVEVMILEDSGNGLQAAVAAGAYGVAVPTRHSVSHCFTGAKFIAETLQDPRIYEALNQKT